jgi:lipid II:glycine glycyltransferase (peptidoglycan interpeptide bridge formation enzyme)
MDINLYFDPINPENNVITNPVHLFFQEIELAIKTAPNELWGFRYSLDITKYVYNQYITLNQVEEEISSFIVKFCDHSSLFPFTVIAEFVNIEGTNILYIKATITNINSSDNEQLTQKFILGL